MVFYAAYALGLAPLLWLAGLHAHGAKLGRRLWWLAGAYAVSFLADTWGLFGPDGVSWVASVVYPISQAAIVGYVLLDRDDAMTFTMTLLAAGMISVVLYGVEGPDVLLRSVAWLGVAGFCLKYRSIGRMRWALLASYGLGWVMWMPVAYTDALWKLGIIDTASSFDPWLAYQGVRAAGIMAFCWAATSPGAVLRLTSPLRASEWGNPYVRGI